MITLNSYLEAVGKMPHPTQWVAWGANKPYSVYVMEVPKGTEPRPLVRLDEQSRGKKGTS